MGSFRVALAPLAILYFAAQTAGPSLRITCPTEGAYLAGPVRLAAVVEPLAAIRDVTQVAFFADGHQICTIVRLPFECEWHCR